MKLGNSVWFEQTILMVVIFLAISAVSGIKRVPLSKRLCMYDLI